MVFLFKIIELYEKENLIDSEKKTTPCQLLLYFEAQSFKGFISLIINNLLKNFTYKPFTEDLAVSLQSLFHKQEWGFLCGFSLLKAKQQAEERIHKVR